MLPWRYYKGCVGDLAQNHKDAIFTLWTLLLTRQNDLSAVFFLCVDMIYGGKPK